MNTEAQKKARAKWDSKNMHGICCKIKNDEYAKFKAYTEARGKTPTGFLVEYIRECIKG